MAVGTLLIYKGVFLNIHYLKRDENGGTIGCSECFTSALQVESGMCFFTAITSWAVLISWKPPKKKTEESSSDIAIEAWHRDSSTESTPLIGS